MTTDCTEWSAALRRLNGELLLVGHTYLTSDYENARWRAWLQAGEWSQGGRAVLVHRDVTFTDWRITELPR